MYICAELLWLRSEFKINLKIELNIQKESTLEQGERKIMKK